MPFSPSQLHCLKAMGVVPWVLRSDTALGQSLLHSAAATEKEPVLISADASTEPAVADRSVNLIPDVAEVSTETLSEAQHTVQSEAVQSEAVQSEHESVLIEDAVEEHHQSVACEPLTTYSSATMQQADLLQRPLVPMSFRGGLHTQIGKADAPLLVVVEATAEVQSHYPFDARDAQLFDDMLRSIQWRRQWVSLCVMYPQEVACAHSQPSVTVADAAKTQRKATLVFTHELPNIQEAAQLSFQLGEHAMPAWYLPHPALLCQSPERKRQAWNVLKAVRQVLPSMQPRP